MQSKVSHFLTLFLVLLLGEVCHQQQNGKLVMIQELFRHGAPYPNKILGIGDQYTAEEKSTGELTSQGKVMHYLLGKRLYDVYWDRLFAGTPFQYRYNQSKFYVNSTNFNRTIESAQSHIAGIFENLPPLNISGNDIPYSSPPYEGVTAQKGNVYGKHGGHIHPIPIHTTEKNMTAFQNGEYLARWDAKNCPNMNVWPAQNYKTPKAKEIFSNPRYVNAVKQLAKALGKPVTIDNFIDYYDDLICVYYMGKEVPSIIYEPSETQEALKSLYLVANYIYYMGNEKQIRAQASEIIAQTITNMKRVQADAYSNPQWIMLSAHDITIAAILSITNLWNLDCLYGSFVNNNASNDKCIPEYPTFASDLIFELYQYPSGVYTFKINYNGVHRRIPFCNYEFECPFEKLESFYEQWRIGNVRSVCGAPYYYTKEMIYAMIGAIIVFLLWFAYMKLRNPKSQQAESQKKEA